MPVLIAQTPGLVWLLLGMDRYCHSSFPSDLIFLVFFASQRTEKEFFRHFKGDDNFRAQLQGNGKENGGFSHQPQQLQKGETWEKRVFQVLPTSALSPFQLPGDSALVLPELLAGQKQPGIPCACLWGHKLRDVLKICHQGLPAGLLNKWKKEGLQPCSDFCKSTLECFTCTKMCNWQSRSWW